MPLVEKERGVISRPTIKKGQKYLVKSDFSVEGVHLFPVAYPDDRRVSNIPTPISFKRGMEIKIVGFQVEEDAITDQEEGYVVCSFNGGVSDGYYYSQDRYLVPISIFGQAGVCDLRNGRVSIDKLLQDKRDELRQEFPGMLAQNILAIARERVRDALLEGVRGVS